MFDRESVFLADIELHQEPLAKSLVGGCVASHVSTRGIRRTFGVCYETLMRWVGEKAEALPAFVHTLLPSQRGDVLELDELWSFVGGKACQLWLWVAL